MVSDDLRRLACYAQLELHHYCIHLSEGDMFKIQYYEKTAASNSANANTQRNETGANQVDETYASPRRDIFRIGSTDALRHTLIDLLTELQVLCELLLRWQIY